eukprot:scaffold771_cov170-Amphora_coffeaeformis.AAC.8
MLEMHDFAIVPDAIRTKQNTKTTPCMKWLDCIVRGKFHGMRFLLLLSDPTKGNALQFYGNSLPGTT